MLGGWPLVVRFRPGRRRLGFLVELLLDASLQEFTHVADLSARSERQRLRQSTGGLLIFIGAEQSGPQDTLEFRILRISAHGTPSQFNDRSRVVDNAWRLGTSEGHLGGEARRANLLTPRQQFP